MEKYMLKVLYEIIMLTQDAERWNNVIKTTPNINASWSMGSIFQHLTKYGDVKIFSENLKELTKFKLTIEQYLKIKLKIDKCWYDAPEF